MFSFYSTQRINNKKLNDFWENISYHTEMFVSGYLREYQLTLSKMNHDNSYYILPPKPIQLIFIFHGEISLIQFYRQFSSMHLILREELIDSCEALKFIYTSRLQAEIIPRCVVNYKRTIHHMSLFNIEKNSYIYQKSLVAQAHPGSGKTVASLLITLQRIDECSSNLQALVVVHLREIAIQTYNTCQLLGQYISNLKISLCIKKESIPYPWDCQICIGTPGTIINNLFNVQNRRNLNNGRLKSFLRSFKILTIDNADQFLKDKKHSPSTNTKNRRRGRQSSFNSLFDQLKRIIDELRYHIPTCQMLLLSESYPKQIKMLAQTISNPFTINIKPNQIPSQNVNIFQINDHEVDKDAALVCAISHRYYIGQMIFFVNTTLCAKQLFDRIQSKMEAIDIPCCVLHGSMNVKDRDKAMEQFRKAETQCLITTDIITRGVELPVVNLVVNYEMPEKKENVFDYDTFLRRINKTGRYGLKGVCINFISKRMEISTMIALDSLNVSILDAESIRKSIQKLLFPEWMYMKMKKWTNDVVLDWIQSIVGVKILNCCQLQKEIEDSQCTGQDLMCLENIDDISNAFNIQGNEHLCKRILEQIMYYKSDRSNVMEQNDQKFRINIFSQEKNMVLNQPVSVNHNVKYIKALYKVQSGVHANMEDICFYYKKELLSPHKTLLQVGIVNDQHLISVKFKIDGSE
eukprot:358436_1